MKIAISDNNYFMLSIEAIDRIADLVNKDKKFHKYYITCFSEDDIEVSRMMKNINDDTFIILSNVSIDCETVKMTREQFWQAFINQPKFNYTIKRYTYSYDYKCRADKKLITAIEELGKDAFDKRSSIKIVEIPDEANWKINKLIYNCEEREVVKYSESKVYTVW